MHFNKHGTRRDADGGDDRAREESQVEIAATAARLLAKVRDKIIDGDRGVMCTSSGRAS